MALTSKQQSEKEFHNAIAEKYKEDELLINENFESPGGMENQWIWKEITTAYKDLKNLKILDLGCGTGESTLYFAKQGLESYGIDISDKCIESAGKLSEKTQIKANFAAGPSESTPYPDNYFEIIYGNGVLHHVDLGPTMKEIKRILKPGGLFFFIEPLSYNPIIKIYRKLAKEVRSPDEHPIKFNDLKTIQQYFPKSKHREFWLTSLSIFILFFLQGKNPSKVRYWKEVISKGHQYKNLLAITKSIDNALLSLFPFLGYLSWNTVIYTKQD